MGYVTTVLILLQLLLIGFLFTRSWLHERQMRAARIEETRTHETPLLPTSYRRSAIELLNTLPSLKSLRGDGLRFVAMPSFGTYHYAIAISLSPGATEAQGVLKAFDSRSWSPVSERTVSERTFAMPAQAYRSLVRKMDKMTDGWPGEATYCLDGSPMAFERVRGQRVTSGIGNCSEHYERLELLMLNYIRRFAPGNDLPTKSDWHRFEE